MTVRNAFQWARHRPRGMAALLFGLLLPVLIGFVALSVDTAVIATARAQLSTAADSAALAGAQQLASEYRVRGITDLTTTIAAANAQSAAFATANHVLGHGVTLVQNPTNVAGVGDMIVGYLDPDNPLSAMVTAPASAPLYNSVQVTATLSSARGSVVPTFFGSLMGFRGANVTVQSTATAWNYSIAGFKSINNESAQLLPIVLDVDTYHAMRAGTTTDQYTYNPVTKAVTDGPDGITESLLYPVSAGLPGNWGTIKVGVSNNSTSILVDQIENGISPSQLATFPGGVIQLDTTLTPPSITFSGNPGISAGISSALQSIIGKPVMIPIYDQSGGNGNNAWYRVIDFVAVRLLTVNFQGNPKYVIVQPALVTDPTAIRGTAQSSWKSGGLLVLHLSR
jgi:Flp pilus assembly protein TadG